MSGQDLAPGARPRAAGRRHAVGEPPTRPAGARLVRFVGVPVRAYLELQQYNDALFRELELIDVELRARPASPTPLPERLVRLVEEFRARFPGVADGYREPVAAAAARSAPTVDLEAQVAPAMVAGARA